LISRHFEPVELGRRHVQATFDGRRRRTFETASTNVTTPSIRPPSFAVDARDLARVGIVEPFRDVGDVRFEGRTPDVDVEQDLVGKAARDEAKPGLLLIVVVLRRPIGIVGTRIGAAVGITRIVRVVAVQALVVGHARWSGAGNHRLQCVLLPRGEAARHTTGGRQLVQREAPIRVLVELPVRVAIALLQAVVRAHAQKQRHEVGAVGELIARARRVRRAAIGREEVAGHVVAARRERRRIGTGHGAECGVAVGPRIGDRRDDEVVDHPALVPAGLVVDDEKAGDIREDVDERSGIAGIGRQSGLRLERDAHRADRRQTAVRAIGGGRRRAIVDAGD
jgi:hypothetical protein